MSLSAPRNTAKRGTEYFAVAVAAAAHIFPGALVCLNAAGYAVPGSASTTLRALGRANEEADNSTGADGAATILVERGAFIWLNSAAGEALTIADVGNLCHIVDDQTVAKTNGKGTRSAAGRVEGIDASGGVWVAIGERALAQPGKVYLPLIASDLVGADGKIYYLPSPVAGSITAIRSVLGGHVLATGNAVLTGKIGATGITGGVLTLLLAASAIGDKVVVAPTDNNVVAIGDTISFTVSGAQDNAAAFAALMVEITL